MITKTTKSFLSIFKWLNTNTCKEKYSPVLTGIHVEYRNMTDTIPNKPCEIFCEATDRFKIVTATFKCDEGINTEEMGICPPGIFKPVFLSHNMIDWKEIPPEDGKFPDTTEVRTINPNLKAPSPIEDKFIISTFFNPEFLVDFIPTFCEFVEFGFSGTFGFLHSSLKDSKSIDTDVSIDIDGVIMPMFPKSEHKFLTDPKSFKTKIGYPFFIEQIAKSEIETNTTEPILETNELNTEKAFA
jgi:hypothetical protein